MRKIFFSAIARMTAAIFICACSYENSFAEQSNQKVRAGDHAVTKQGSFMCLTADGASAFVEHAIQGEKTKLEQILKTGSCSLVRDGMKVKVLAVRDNVSEVVRIDVTSPTPLWVGTKLLQPVFLAR